MDNASWGALSAALMIAGGIWSFFAFRAGRHGTALQAAGTALLAPAAWLTGLLKVLGRVADAVSDWAIRFVFSPSAWAGIILGVVAVVTFAAGSWLKARQTPASGSASSARVRTGTTTSRQAGGAGGSEFDDIEALLRKRGIN